jgi:hypothetical protein
MFYQSVLNKENNIMKVQNMTSARGNKIANQFIINDRFYTWFQSYGSTIARESIWNGEHRVELDRDKWDYSVTTSKYRNIFLGETTKETQKKIDSGEYILTNLN